MQGMACNSMQEARVRLMFGTRFFFGGVVVVVLSSSSDCTFFFGVRQKSLRSI